MIRNRPKNRVVQLLAIAMGLVLFTSACGDDDDPEATDDTDPTEEMTPDFEAGTTMARIAEQKTIKVGVKFDQPGFGQVNPTTGGDPEGFDVEIAELIVDAIGEDVEIEWVESISANRETFIENGTVDLVVATYTINDARKQKIDFAGPYFIAGQDTMVRADDDSIKSVDDLNGKEVCTVTGSTSADNVVAKAPEAKVTLLEKYSECAEGVADGRYDALTTDNAILLGLVVNGDGAFKLVDNKFSDEPYGIGVTKDDDAFRDFVNDVLEEIYANGDWAEAFEGTLGEIGLSTPTPPPVDRYTETPPAPSTTTTSG